MPKRTVRETRMAFAPDLLLCLGNIARDYRQVTEIKMQVIIRLAGTGTVWLYEDLLSD